MRVALLVGLALALAGCATALSPPPGTVTSPVPGREPATATAPAAGAARAGAPSPIPGTPVGTTASGGQIVTTQPEPAVVDTAPSPDALAVLETIPEPLSASELVPPPARAGGAAPAPGNATDSVEVPTPAPTPPLGDRPGSLRKTADSAAVSSPALPAPRTVPPDSCWRVQVAAPQEPEKARALREAASSQLLVAMTVEIDKGLHKVRTRDCLGAEAADQLKRRALAAGFPGAFRFRGGPR